MTTRSRRGRVALAHRRFELVRVGQGRVDGVLDGGVERRNGVCAG
ncbi:hypothetical protein ACIQCF_23305 [Streptomyces sp. NPDC088353]